jgi:hypothetical protein
MQRVVGFGLTLLVFGSVVSGCSSSNDMPGNGSMGATATGGSTSTDSGADAAPRFPAAPLATFASTTKAVTVALRTMPAQPPYVGPGSEAQLMITDANGQPVTGLTVAALPWMPVMGHGTPVATKVVEQGAGVYLVEDLSPSMPGEWELKLTISGSVTDRATSPGFTVAQQQ